MALLIHDPRDVEQVVPKRTPITESYWQRGCNDAKAGRPEKWPSRGGGFDRRNVGYANGYAFGSGVAGSRTSNYRVSTDLRGHTVVEAHMACINGLSAWVMVADLGKEHPEDQMFGGFDREAIGQKIVAALGERGVDESRLDAYCKAWERSFSAANPHCTVSMDPEDREHILAGLRAALGVPEVPRG
jgi:hypothetical protein